MIKLIKIIVCLILVSSNFSCKSQQLNITGTYYWTDSLKISSAELILNKDSTFQYWFQAGDLYRINSEGHWSFSQHTKQLLLNSKVQSMDNIIGVKEIRNSELPLGIKKISIFDINNNPYFGYIIVNPSSHGLLKFDNKNFIDKSIFLKDVNVREMAVNYFDLGSQVLFYTIKDSMANDIKIHIQISAIKNYRFFKNQKWQLGFNRLIDTDTSFNKNDKKIYLKNLNNDRK